MAVEFGYVVDVMKQSILLPVFFALNLSLCFAERPAYAEGAVPVQFTWALQDVIKIATEQNPDIKSALANFDAASKGIMVATSGVLPRVDISSSYEETTLPTPSAGLSAQLGTALPYGSAVAGLSQLVYDFGKTLNDIASSKALSNAAEQQAEAVRIAVTLGAERAFYDVAGAEELVLVARQGVAEFEETRRRIDLMVRAKARPSFDLSQASVELSQAKLGLIKAINDKDIAKIFLLNILGMPSHVNFNLKGAEPSRMIDADKLNVEKLINTAMDKRPEIKQRDFELDSAKARLLREQGSFYPSVSVGGWYGQFYGKFPSTIDNAWGGGVMLEWNIFEGYKTTGRVGESLARINETSAVLEKQKLNISAEVAKGVMDLKRQGSTLLVAKENLDNSKENARLAKLRYEASVATFLELLIAQTTLLNAEAQNVRARYDYEVALATLTLAVGGPIE